MKKRLSFIKDFLQKHNKLCFALFCVIAFYYVFVLVLKIVPYKSLNSFATESVSLRIYDCDKNLIQILPLENGLKREWTDIKYIPKNIQKAIIRAEDKRFYFHNGIDFLAIINAAFQNTQNKKTVRGASTISMQLAKMIEPQSKRTFFVKIKEAINALRIEAKLSKKEILELYLNKVPFAYNCEGITSAARTFFGCELKDLTPEQIACLSVTIRRPTSYNPISNPENCAKIASSINPHIEYDILLKTAQSSYVHSYPFLMPHYIYYLKENYFNTLPKNQAEITLSVSLALQQFCQNELKQALEIAKESRVNNGAILVLNNNDNSVISWVGSADFYDENEGQIDGVLVPNHPGSSLKPFLYALALDQKDEKNLPLLYPSMCFSDIPMEFGGEKKYIPENFNNRFNGPVRMRIALASSLNVPAVDLLSKIGVNNYLETLYKLNINSLKPQAHLVDLGLALGSGEVPLIELTPAFSVFTRDGKYLPLCYEKNSEKQITKIQKSKGSQIYSKDSSRLICSILSDKGARSLGFGDYQTFQTSYPSIFKTGTSNQFQNIVALGSTKEFTVGVWMGNHTGQTVIGKTGSSLPASVAKNILDYLNIYSKLSESEKQFLEPENYHKEKICTLSGLKASKNCQATVFEYVPNNLSLSECTWHYIENNKIQVKYPSEYQQWARMYELNANIDYSSSPLSIKTPQNNSIFYYSMQNSDIQAIPVEVFGGQENEIQVFYDDDKPFSVARPFYFLLPVQRGEHTCKIVCGGEEESIFFTVK